MGLFKSSGNHKHRFQASVGSAVSSCPSSSSSSSSAAAPARDRTTAVLSSAPKFVNSLVTWEKQNEQHEKQPPTPQPTRGERAQYAHAGTDWEARNSRARQAGHEEPPKKPSWTERLFMGPGLGVYGS